MYTIERHLDLCGAEGGQFEIINSIWKLNKMLIPSAQRAISFNFPHYSLHERSHSETIIRRIESFLGGQRIKQLSPSDAWMILMAAFTHDLGMVVFHTALEKKWTEEDFQFYLKKISDFSSDKDLKAAATLLINLNNPSLKREANYALEIRKAVIIVTADYYRKYHHQRSKEIISGIDQEFLNLMNGFNLKGIPNRFSNILAEVAYAHGINFYSVIDRLEYEADGFGSDKTHPRFVACLLRLGDLLDVDDQRFDVFSEKVFSDKLPHLSQLHSEKHSSTKHLLVSPNSIEITVDCKTDEVYRVAREWFDWLQEEVENQSREWSSIAPTDVTGMAPTISRGKLKVLYRSVEPKKELMNLRFSISNKKVFEILEGSALYEAAEFVFLREIVQNAVDATKLKLWKVIESGVYDYAIRQHLNITDNTSHGALMKKVEFPSNLPKNIFENFQIDLNVKWSNESNDKLLIEVIDKGTGISEKDLIRMTHNVGESRSNDLEFLRLKQTIPYWLKPTGAFGIGLQSLFLVAESFIIQTKSENEEAIEILFVSAKGGEYSKITDIKPTMAEGTKVIVEIPKTKFQELFGGSLSMNLVEKFDVFSDKLGDIHLHKIKEYLLNEFQKIEYLNINFFDEEIKTSLFNTNYKAPYHKENVVSEKRNSENSILVRMADLTWDMHVKRFFVSEKTEEIGSELIITFFSEYEHVYSHQKDNNLYPQDQYFVRNIPIDERFPGFYVARYFKIQWNFQSPESDKILNISRDKLIRKTKQRFNTILIDKLLPKSLELISYLYEERYKDVPNQVEAIAAQYFHIELSCLMSHVKTNHNKNIYNQFELPESLVTYSNLVRVPIIDFFQQNIIYTISKEYSIPEMANTEDIRRVWREAKPDVTEGIIFWKTDYFSYFLIVSGFQIKSIEVIAQANGKLNITKYQNTSNELLSIETNGAAKSSVINRYKNELYSQRRPLIPPIQPYAETLGVKEPFDGIYLPSRYSDYYIVSPFKNVREISFLKEKLAEEIKSHNVDALKRNIKASYLGSLIPQSLVEWVKTNNGSGKQINNDEILNAYTDLIVDIILEE
ncbi:MAG: ATP-binding protein [Chitinophagaceae bacterium]|nr:ATP-binding protein [Chitinophagaceae bacterium]